jgi:hypothetical protein
MQLPARAADSARKRTARPSHTGNDTAASPSADSDEAAIKAHTIKTQTGF